MRTFEKTYSILFGRSPKKVALYAAAFLAALTFYKSLSYIYAPLYYFGFGALLFTLLLAVDRSVVNPRRSFYVASISTLAVALLDSLFGKPPLTFALVGGIISALVIQSLRCKSPVFTLPLFSAAAVYLLTGNTVLAAVSVIYILVVYSLKPLVKKMAGGLDAMCMFSSFLYAVFAEDDMIEDAFRELGRREKVPLHLYLIGGRHVVVVSDFHPGPFRHIGGGMLIDALNREIERLGYSFTFLHGVGSHERDPITKSSVLKIVEAAKSTLSYMQNGAPPRAVRTRVVEIGDVRIVGFSLGAAPHLAIVSRVNSASDDIPLWVAKNVDPGLYVLVDAQNKFDGAVHWRDEDVKALADGLAKLHETPLCTTFKVGVGKADTAHLDPLGVELGPAGISAIVAQCDDQRSLLVVFDGNNLDGELYRRVVQRYRDVFDVVEVVTTDTHRSTGVGLGRGYRIVGERLRHDDILKAVEQAVASALDSLGPQDVSYSRVEVEAEVLGEEGFRKIQKAVKIYKKVGITILTAVFLVPTLVITVLA